MYALRQDNNDEKEAKLVKAEQDCLAYQQMLKEKDASIGELQKKVRESVLFSDTGATGSEVARRLVRSGAGTLTVKCWTGRYHLVLKKLSRMSVQKIPPVLQADSLP